MYGGLLVLRVLTRKYEFRDDVSGRQMHHQQQRQQLASSRAACFLRYWALVSMLSSAAAENI